MDSLPVRNLLRHCEIMAATLRSGRDMEGAQPLTTPAVSLFFVLAVWQTWLALIVLELFGLQSWELFIIETGFLQTVTIPFLVYMFSPEVFTRRYWRLPRTAWKSVAVAFALQVANVCIPPHGGPCPKYRIVAVLVLAPVGEEIMRAVMLPPLVARWGTVLGVGLVSAVTAGVHDYSFIRAVGPQVVLSIIFIKNDRSITTSAISHFVMNLIGVVHSGIGP